MRGGLALILLLIILPFTGVSCSAESSLAQKARGLGNFLQEKVSRPLADWIKNAQDKTLNFMGDTGESFVKNLTDKEKAAVEEWLVKNKLNQYGDKKGAVYTGGTPLFNEQTGETLNRYEYLFKKFPELKDIIKNAVTEKSTEKK